MRQERISLMPDRPEVYMDFMGNDDVSAPCPAVLIMPGGGYSRVCSARAGWPVALSYMMHGLAAFVLNYPTGAQIRDPLDPLHSAALAMLHIRAHAAEYCIDPARVCAVGLSAGGHLAGSLATLWNDKELQARLGGCGAAIRPDCAVLCYPVITGGEFTHADTFRCLLGARESDPALRERFSIERHVGAHCPPAFIMHTMDDEGVPAENALLLAMAYSAAKLPCELHIYPHGPHGMALANRVTWMGDPAYADPAVARWVELSCAWMGRTIR